MPIYDFRCECGEVTEARVGVDVSVIPCPACGRLATRDLPRNIALHGLPTRKVQDREPDEDEQRKKLKRQGWDGDRAMEFIRKGIHEDGEGHKMFSTRLAEQKGG